MLRTCAVLLAGAVAGVGLAAPVVTIYSVGFGFVVDARPVLLFSEGDLVLTDLPLTVLVDSLVVDGLPWTRMGAKRTDLPTVDGLVGREVSVFARGERFVGHLLSAAPGLVLATAEGVMFLASYDRIVADVPLGRAPSLAVTLHYRGATPGRTTIGLRYLAEGLTWGMSYTATLNADALALQGTGRIENRTGVDFPGAKVSLVAGDVYRPTAKDVEGTAVRALAFSPEADLGPAFEYHRYVLSEPVALTQGALWVPLVAGDLPYTRAYRFSGSAVEARVRFTNTLAPLPAGEVRFYDGGGDLFVGVGTIGHTPVGREVDLAIGAAFDLAGERVLEARERVADNTYRDTYRITLRSAKDAPVEVEAVETLSGTWTITSSSLSYERLDAWSVLFRVLVPARGTAEVRYTVEWRY